MRFWLCVLAAFPLLADSPDERLARAVELASANRLEEAERVLLEGRKDFARDARFAVELAGVTWRRKQTGKAKGYLRQALRLEPKNDYANEFLGTAYLLDGNVHAAVKYLNRVRRPVIASVAITPPPRLRPAMVERLSGVSAGQLLTPARLADTERNFNRLRLFGPPQFELAPIRDNQYALTVRAPSAAAPLSGTLGRVLPLLRALPYQAVNLDFLNLGQSGASLTSLGRWDPDKRRVMVAYRTPRIHSAYSFFADLRDENWTVQTRNLDVRSATLGAQVEFELGGGQRWTPGAYLSRHTFRQGGDQPAFTNSTLWELRNRFDLPRWRYEERRVTVDSSLTARTGRVFSATSSRLLGAEFDSSLHWLPQAKDDRYQVTARLRAAALSGNLPVDTLYATAMERDSDLWLRGHVGTRDGRKGNAPMGTRFAVVQMGVSRRILRIPFVRVDAGPFLDTGNVGGVATLGSRGFLYDTGVQADVSVMGSFRVSVVYGRDLRYGHHVFYTALSR